MTHLFPDRPFALVTALAVAAAGCASTAPDEGALHRACREEQARERAAHALELAELRTDLARRVDDVEAQRRELARSGREVTAAQERADAQEASFQAALSLLRQRDAELAELRARLDEAAVSPETGPASEVAGALALLRRKDEEIRALRQEMARIAAGPDADAPRPELAGIVRLSSVDLQAPVARLDGEPVSRRDFVEYLYRDVGSPGLLELCVNRFLVLREARRRNVEVSDVDVAVWTEEQLMQHVAAAGSPEAFEARLREEGFTRAAWEARLRYQARPTLLLQRLVELERTTPGGAEAFEARLRAAYLESYGERVTARHVLVRVGADAAPDEVEAARRLAAAACDEVRRGIPFADVARRRSEDRDSRPIGGSLGTFDRSKFAAHPEVNTAFFTLEPGRLSEPVRSRLGWHVLLVEQRHPPERPYDDEVRRALIAQLEGRPPADSELEALVARLRARSHIVTSLSFD